MKRLAGLLAVVMVAGCGGGGDDPAPEAWSGVTIEAPTLADRHQTTQSSIDLGGRAFVPAGSFCNALIGTIAPGYTVTWRNAANDSAGTVPERQLNCLLAVSLTWQVTGIPLTPGLNPITVTARAADGETGSDQIVVERLTTP